MRLGRLRILGHALTVVAAVLACPHPATGDPIPLARRTDWSYAGVPGGIPNRTKICATFSVGATVSQINGAISSCSAGGGGVVRLNPGTYDLEGIAIGGSNVTLRGAGADQTILRGGSILSLGTGSATTLARPLTGGGVKDSRTFSVSSISGLSVNQMIELSRDDDPVLVVSTNGGGTRHMHQVNLITAIDGTSVTVKNPWFMDFCTGNPQLLYTFTNTSFSGVEDLKLDHSGTANTGYAFFVHHCYACWIRGVESYKPASYHFMIGVTLNVEVRDSYIHESQTYGPQNGGLEVYGNLAYGVNSNGKIENNIFDRLFPSVTMQNSSGGFYVGYNYFHGSQSDPSGSTVTWTMADNHGPHDMMNLWEGNIGEMFGSDGYYGGSSHGTAARNYLTGFNPNFGAIGEPVRLNRLAYYYNLVGNVLGSSAMNPGKYAETQDSCGGTCTAIFRLGWPNIGNSSLTDSTGYAVPGGMTYPDAKVAATLLRWGNYDYYSRSTRWVASETPSGVPVPGEQVIPNSYYYTNRPGWLPPGVAWPPIGPDVTGGNGDPSGHVNKIPAQLCWETRGLLGSGSFNASACYPRPPRPPTNVVVKAPF